MVDEQNRVVAVGVDEADLDAGGSEGVVEEGEPD